MTACQECDYTLKETIMSSNGSWELRFECHVCGRKNLTIFPAPYHVPAAPYELTVKEERA